MDRLQKYIDIISSISDSTVLELAAAYDYYNFMGLSESDAKEKMISKKGEMCIDEKTEEQALDLIRRLRKEAS